MTNFINTKILLSAAVILAAAAVIVGATFAFFSDTETSEDNVFAAGQLDLKVDNESYALDCNIPESPTCLGVLVVSEDTSWESIDLTTEKFFNFVDVKPGDYGEDTISLTVEDNDAYVCAAAQITDDGEGDLASGINFAFWADDGDNVLETDEEDSLFAVGPISNLNPEGIIALAEPGNNVWGNANDVFPGGATQYIGKGWCFGTMTPDALLADSDDGPLVRGTGFECDGSEVGNVGQGDSVTGDIQFLAVQARNNEQFSCDSWDPEWPEVPVQPIVEPEVDE